MTQESNSKPNAEQQFTFRIISADVVKNYESDPDDYQLPQEDPINAEVETGFEIGIRPTEETITLTIDAKFNYKNEDGSRELLFSLVSRHAFQVQEMQEVFKTEKPNEIRIPDQIMMIVLNISIAGTRGMIAASVRNQRYKKVILPLLDMNSIMTGIKSQVVVHQNDESSK